MFLITGGTGFIGRALLRHMFEAGHPLRTLIRPSPRTPRLPTGVPLEVAVASLSDPRGLRAALSGVDYIIHLASAEGLGNRGDLFTTDIQGTKNLAEAAADAGVKRIVYVSHLGADRMSAFAVHKAKGIAEEHIRRSGVPYTILRSSIVFGPEDRFTVPLTRLLRAAPGLFPLPGGGRAVVQPLWIEDLVTCILWAFEKPEMENQTCEIGGSEYFPLRQVVETIMDVNRRRRIIVPLSMPNMRVLIILLDAMFPNFPFSSYSLDYFSINRTCPVDNLTRAFGLMPARFTYRLEYLRRVPWTQRFSRWTSVQTKRAAERLRERFPSLRPPE
jgi:NADH dehydrogenase